MRTLIFILASLILGLIALKVSNSIDSRFARESVTYSTTLQDVKTMKENTKFRSRYDNVEVEKLPAQISLSEEEKAYLETVIASINNLIAHKSLLHNEERTVLGPGKFFWPKDPGASTELIKYYDEENFRFTGISLTLRRKDRTAEWSNAVLTIIPRNFPHGSYLTELPATILEEYVLKNTAEEVREHAQVIRPIVYHFSHKIQAGVVMRVESRPALQSKPTDLPDTFYAIEISRE